MATLSIGATAFSHAAAFTPDSALPIIEQAAAIGLTNLQFLLDHMPDDDIRAVGKMCRMRGITPITVAVMFPPTCPTGDSEAATSARRYTIETARKARILSGDPDNQPCILTGPILRCLLHARKGGLPLPEERNKQVTFLRNVATDLRSVPGVRVGIEPINRTESCSNNKVGDVLSVIDQAEAGDIFGVLADLFHMHMSETDSVAEVLTRHVKRIVQVHLSELQRTSLKLSRAVTPDLLKLLCGPEWASIPITMESFTAETPEGFFTPLMVNDLPNQPVFDLYAADYDYVQKIVA